VKHIVLVDVIAVNSRWEGAISEHIGVLASYGVKPQGYLGFMIGECGKKDGILRYYTFGRALDSDRFGEEKMFEVGKTKITGKDNTFGDYTAE